MKNKGFSDYQKTYGYKSVQDKLDVYGLWHVQGEDTNPDFGGSHHQPTLGYFEGVLRDVMEYAFTLKGFWSWGGGGNFTQIEIVKVDENTAERMQEMLEEKKQLEERLAEINRKIK